MRIELLNAKPHAGIQSYRQLKLAQLLGQLSVFLTFWNRFPRTGYGLSEARSPVSEVAVMGTQT